MSIETKHSAVVFLVFNRPELTRRTLAGIRQARPGRLLVVADGPRSGIGTDTVACRETRAAIEEGIDWPCDVRRNYADVNMGCASRVATGLDWAFSVVEEAIILEDDCLPAPGFFPFCSELLERYRDDRRIGQICGTPLIAPTLPRPTSYIFSRYGPIWGWASWRRAWASYDLAIRDWPSLRAAGHLSSAIFTRRELRWRRRLYDGIHAGRATTWDYQWGYAKLSQSMLSVIPCQNLVRNIGFGPAGTHTRKTAGQELPLGRVETPLAHPAWILPDIAYDQAFSEACTPSMARSARRIISSFDRSCRPRLQS